MFAIKRLKTKYLPVTTLLAALLFTTLHAWGAISIDVKASGDGTAASTTVSTPLISTNSGNELLLAFVSTDYLSGTNTTVQGIAGGGLTWLALSQRFPGFSPSRFPTVTTPDMFGFDFQHTRFNPSETIPGIDLLV